MGLKTSAGEEAQDWQDRFSSALVERFGPALGERLANEFAARFPQSYREAVDAATAAADVAVLRTLEGRSGEILARFELPEGPAGAADAITCRVFSAGARVELSRLVPIFECLGFWVVDGLPWSLRDEGLHLHRFALRTADGSPIDVAEGAARLAAAVHELWGARAEVDSLDRLVLVAKLSVEEVALLRAYRRYRQQIDNRYSASYINDVLVSYPHLAHTLVEYFAARFAPSVDASRVAMLRSEALAGIDATSRLDHDRILRGLLGTIDATVRTNRHLRPEGPLALKLESPEVPGIPAPVPRHEIFVDGPTVEGVHLRFGDVARGGIRWSDRPEDYRSEVLDLARTQVVKNSLIVPTGSKGGFVLRNPPPKEEPAALQQAVKAAYEGFIGGLLDLTDDVRHGEVVAVPRRLDSDDPYLVVAADKGTAALSDTANSLALARDFWLGDAFASGGSHGYDHKELGVTARGAWVAVQRHFRALGVDVQHEPFTVVGIGDMSGDVFGNGLLRSPTARLIAAFDHRDIFCDPDPDPATGFAERQRLLGLARSSWQDYDRTLLSEGGGVWSRDVKRIELHSAVRGVLRVEAGELTPAELIRAILLAPVDLLFVGGIGTFVRSSTEEDVSIDDRANSELRVEAASLRARVVGEGANLAFTQRARVEYAKRGGHINMDAVDNAAGVDTSDHEVNLKILLALAIEDGEIDLEERNALLVDHTGDVVDAVLDDVGRQCDTISRAQLDSAEDLGAYAGLLDALAQEGTIDPTIDCLPDAAELARRSDAGGGLTRPELAVLAAGAKRQLRTALVASPLPDVAALRRELVAYFPAELSRRFDHLLDRHRLRRELIATMLANSIIDHLGMVFVPRVVEDTGAPLADVAAAAWVALQVAGPDLLAARLAAAGASLEKAEVAVSDPGAAVGAMVADLLAGLTRSYLLEAGADPGSLVARDEQVVDALLAVDASHERTGSETGARGRWREEVAQAAVADGFGPAAAAVVATLADIGVVPGAARLASQLRRDAVAVALAFLRVADRLELTWYRSHLDRLKLTGYWAHAARRGLLGDLDRLCEEIVRAALSAEASLDGPEAVDRWIDRHARAVADAARVRDDVAAERDPDLDALAVAVRALFTAADTNAVEGASAPAVLSEP